MRLCLIVNTTKARYQTTKNDFLLMEIIFSVYQD